MAKRKKTRRTKTKPMKKAFNFLKKTFFATVPVVAGLGAVGLGIRYLGDKPVIEDVAKGLNGDVKGWFK